MAEFTNANTVTVAAGQNIPLTETAVSGGNCIVHREGAGIVTLRGLTRQCRAQFKVSFGANIGLPEDGTVDGGISMALSINGEALNSATGTVTPAAAEEYNNIFVAAFVEVPQGCCLTVAAENTSTVPISVANANLIVERTA